MKNQPYLLFGGDFAPIGRMLNLMTNDNFIDDEIKKEIENSILTLVNLEAPATNATNKIPKSGPNLKLDPSVISLAKKTGINGFFLANNHIMDYGIQGLEDTLMECRLNNISVLGAGLNLVDASKELNLNYNGIKICIVNYAENEFGAADEYAAGFSPLNIIKNFKQLKRLRINNDILIVSIHGGIEHLPLPPKHLRELCNFFISEGCDAVVCHHNHIASAYEYVDNKPIFYGLGNFIFDGDKKNLDWQIGFLLKLKINEDVKKLDKFEMIPYMQSYDLGGIKRLDSIEQDNFFLKIKKLNDILNSDIKYEKYLSTYYSRQEIEYILLMYFPFIYRPVSLLRRIPFIKKIMFSFARHLIRLNLIRCESHYEILKFIHMNNNRKIYD